MAPAQGWHAQIEKCKWFFCQFNSLFYTFHLFLYNILQLCILQGHHTFSAFWLWSSVVSVLISVTTDMSPTGDLIVTFIFAGEVSSWACSRVFMCCARIALLWLQLTLRGNKMKCCKVSTILQHSLHSTSNCKRNGCVEAISILLSLHSLRLQHQYIQLLRRWCYSYALTQQSCCVYINEAQN